MGTKTVSKKMISTSKKMISTSKKMISTSTKPKPVICSSNKTGSKPRTVVLNRTPLKSKMLTPVKNWNVRLVKTPLKSPYLEEESENEDPQFLEELTKDLDKLEIYEKEKEAKDIITCLKRSPRTVVCRRNSRKIV